MAPTAPPEGIVREDANAATDDSVGALLPVGFRATSDEEGFELVVNARPRWAGFLFFFAILWNGFMVMWFGIAFTQGQWGMAVAGTLHGAVGFLVGYLALRGMLNRVELSVRRGVLDVRHRPLPWPAPPPAAREEIDQLYVEEDTSLEVNGQPVLRFRLKLRLKSGKEHKLLILDKLEQAQFLEREVERAFAIEDRALIEEVAKPNV
jgi:hypothetical protein